MIQIIDEIFFWRTWIFLYIFIQSDLFSVFAHMFDELRPKYLYNFQSDCKTYIWWTIRQHFDRKWWRKYENKLLKHKPIFGFDKTLDTYYVTQSIVKDKIKLQHTVFLLL